MKTSTAVVVFGACVLLCLVGMGQACTMSEMSPCLEAVTKGTPPSQACCAKVGSVDVQCFCEKVKESNYPQAYVKNALGIPAKCGQNSAAYARFKGQLCAGYKIG